MGLFIIHINDLTLNLLALGSEHSWLEYTLAVTLIP